jgi:hypothetical protein
MLQAIFRNSDTPSAFLQAIWFDAEHRNLIGLAADNQPPASGTYVCFVAVMDYWRLKPDDCATNGVAHFSASVEQTVIQDVKAGRALLVLDLSNEGPAFQRSQFDAIHTFLDENAIPANRAIFLSQNRAIESYYMAAYRSTRASLMRFEYYDYYIKLMAHWFASPSWREKTIGNNADYAVALNDPTGKHWIALCLNATPRLHRVWTVAGLHHYRILDRCLVSFSGLSYAKGLPLNSDWVISATEAEELHFLWQSCKDVIALGPLQVDNFVDTGNQLVDKIDIDTYLSTYFSIVTETDFTDGEVDRITEKAVKVFCLGHPAFVIGNPGAIQFVTDLGFQDFTPALPSDYDRIRAPPIRFTAVFAEILAQVVLIQADPAGWLARMSEVSRFNINYATGGLLRHYKQRHDKRVLAAWDELLAGADLAQALT